MNFDHFDTLLAFAAIMAGFSLIITALTQAVSGLFGLRGLNLKWGLEELLATLAPAAAADAKALAHHVLLHPLLSDSTFSGLKKRWTWWRYASHVRAEELSSLLEVWRKALDLPAGTEVQRAARAQAVRALNLDALLKEVAAQRWKAALRELVRTDLPSKVLDQLPDGSLKQVFRLPATNAKEKARREAAMDKLKIDKVLPDLTKLVRLVIGDGGRAIPSAVFPTLPGQLKKVLDLPQGTDDAKALRATRLKAFDLAGAFLDEAAESLAEELKTIGTDLGKRFDMSMDRISQRFTANMRVITIAGAAVVSLGLVVDSVDLWKQLARSPELRSEVIASSDALLKKADEMQAGSTNLPAAVYRVAAGQLLSMHTNELSGFSGTEVVTNLSSGTNWLVTQCRIHSITNTARWLEEYQALVPQATLRQAADQLNDLLEDQLALGVISSRRPNESWWEAICGHWDGILVSIVLLSLGAPFWFNLLRSLSNLRPVLATKDTEEQRARRKATASGK